MYLSWSRDIRNCSFRVTAVGVTGYDNERSLHKCLFSDNSKADFSRVMYEENHYSIKLVCTWQNSSQASVCPSSFFIYK